MQPSKLGLWCTVRGPRNHFKLAVVSVNCPIRRTAGLCIRLYPIPTVYSWSLSSCQQSWTTGTSLRRWYAAVRRLPSCWNHRTTDTAPEYLVCSFQRVSRRHDTATSTLGGNITSSQLVVPATRCLTLGDRAFPVAAARAWNALPHSVTSASTLLIFRRFLKTRLFHRSFYS